MDELLLWKQKYIHYLELEKALSTNSVKAIQSDLDYFFAFYRVEGVGLDILQLKRYPFHLQEQGFQVRSIQRRLSSLKGFLRFLKQRQVEEEDLSVYILLPSVEEESFHALSFSSWEKFREEFSKNVRDRAIFELLYSTGLRVSEFLSLSMLQIHWEKREIYLVNKGKKRTVFFSQRAKEALQTYCEQERIQEGLLWRFSEVQLRQMLKEYKDRGSLEQATNLYSFRHSFALRLLEQGMPKEEVQYLLGLEQGQGLERYLLHIKKGN